MSEINRRKLITRTAAMAATLVAPRIGWVPAHAQVASDLTDLSAASAVEAMKKGDITAEAYATALCERAVRLSNLNAFRTLDKDALLEAAREADKLRSSGAPLGLLHGLPIPVKDSINSASLPTSNGTASLRDFLPQQDAATLSLLKERGALLMGKTNLHELSTGWTSTNEAFGPVRNPYDPSRIPGGSSGGSAVAVAARMAPLALGEDTLGSIRTPASACGVVGLRPTFGRYPNAGTMPLMLDKFDQVGPFARSVADVALFDAAVTGDLAPLIPMPLRGVRIGIPKGSYLDGLEEPVDTVVNQAFKKLVDAGAVLVPVDLPRSVTAARDIAIGLFNFELMPSVAAFLAEQRAPVNFEQLVQQAGPTTQAFLRGFAMSPNRPSQSTYDNFIAARSRLIEDLSKVFASQSVVALAFPPIMVVPQKIGAGPEVRAGFRSIPMAVAMLRNLALGSCAGSASLVLPAGLTRDSLPVGLEFLAPAGKDRELLALGLSLEIAIGKVPAPVL